MFSLLKKKNWLISTYWSNISFICYLSVYNLHHLILKYIQFFVRDRILHYTSNFVMKIILVMASYKLTLVCYQTFFTIEAKLNQCCICRFGYVTVQTVYIYCFFSYNIQEMLAFVHLSLQNFTIFVRFNIIRQTDRHRSLKIKERKNSSRESCLIKMLLLVLQQTTELPYSTIKEHPPQGRGTEDHIHSIIHVVFILLKATELKTIFIVSFTL